MSPQASKHVRIRMYNVGFGDCFLLFIPTKSGERKILFDCGTHFQSKGPRRAGEVAEMIVEDAKDADGVSRIDVVVGTHRHQDHVSGFENEIWEEVEVREVWMPWTEDADDPDGRRILDKQSKKALQLAMAVEKFGLGPGVQAMAVNSYTNEKAMRTLHEGFANDPERCYFPYKERARNTFKRKFLPGVTVHVLGPSRDPEVVRDMEPEDDETFKRLLESSPGRDGGARLPFHRDWSLMPKQFTSAAKHLSLTQSEMKKLKGIGESDAFAIAVALEKAVNGTSLMLMLQIGDAYLLFPGDAQWGTWNAAMQDDEWRALMEKTTFYKVGHHGSHNATPETFVREILGKKFSAMVCTGPSSNKHFGDIPLRELLIELRKKSKKVVRSDMEDVPDPKTNCKREADLFVEMKIPL
jgi:beta-lactamase superfamily II metal-dependent hydrolase